MARFFLGRKKAGAADAAPGTGDGGPPSSATVLAERLGLKRGAGGPGAAAAPHPRRRIDAFLLTVAASVLVIAGIVAWLAAEAPETLARRARQSALPDMTLTMVDGTPRIGTAPLPAEADPTARPVVLAPSRNESLVERSQSGGLLPHVSDKGPAPWQAYARPFPQEDSRPRIALVISDMGWSPTMLDLALARLPGAVTLAFVPGAPDLQAAIDKARADGHEVLLQIPLEPLGFPRNDPGPNTLLTTLNDEKNVARLETAMAAATGYVGLTSLSGSKFLTDAGAVRSMLEQVQRRGLIYVDSWLTAGSLATRQATALHVPRAISDTQIDRVASPAGVAAQLAELERLAKANGVAVGYAQPYPMTVEQIARWFVGLHDRGIVLAPITAVVNRQADR